MALKQTCSILITLLNEQENLLKLYNELLSETNKENRLNWEFVLVDDGSTDQSFEILKSLQKKDKRIKVVKLSRNFGPHEGTAAAIHHASGDIGIIMSADLQDPPAVIHDFLKKWREGFDIVWAYRASRKDPFFKKILAKAYYWGVKKLAPEKHSIQGKQSGSFCLITRQVMDLYKNLNEHNRVTFELIAWFGFKQAEIVFHRPNRYGGKSKFSLRLQTKTALDSLFVITQFPIRLMFFLGFISAVFSLGWALLIVIYAILGESRVEGWSSIMVTVLFFGSVQLLSASFLGEYLWRLLEESRGRPLFATAEVLESCYGEGSTSKNSKDELEKVLEE